MSTEYSLSWILPFVRNSLRERGGFDYSAFVWGVWRELEKVGTPGIVKTPPEQMYTGQPYQYSAADSKVRRSAVEAFYYLRQNGFIVPMPPDNAPHDLREYTFVVTERGQEWAKGAEPLPEDAKAYMALLRELVPSVDSVIEQYIVEALSTFDRRNYFASAVMVGAAAEKAIYLLAESMAGSLKDKSRGAKFRKLIEQRRLASLLDGIEEIVKDAKSVLPFAIFDGAVSHLMSLFDAIRVQRNDAVHPMNAACSPDSIRLSLKAFPYALRKADKLRHWFIANPSTI